MCDASKLARSSSLISRVLLVLLVSITLGTGTNNARATGNSAGTWVKQTDGSALTFTSVEAKAIINSRLDDQADRQIARQAQFSAFLIEAARLSIAKSAQTNHEIISDQLNVKSSELERQVTMLRDDIQQRQETIAPLKDLLATQSQNLILRARSTTVKDDGQMRRLSAIIRNKLENYEQQSRAIAKLEADLGANQKKLGSLNNYAAKIRRAAQIHSGLITKSRKNLRNAYLIHTEQANRQLAQKMDLDQQRQAQSFQAGLDAWSIRSSLSDHNVSIVAVPKKAAAIIDSKIDLDLVVSAHAAIPFPPKKHVLNVEKDVLGANFQLSALPSTDHFRAVWATIPTAGQLTEGIDDGGGFRIIQHAKQPVVAPGNGEVIFADRFKNFGELLIIDHGGDYHTLLAGLTVVDVTVGQRLVAGQLVGTVDKPRDSTEALYVELRYRGQPVSPVAWFAQRQTKKVQG